MSQAALAMGMGALPEPGEHAGCAGCGHPFALHGNGTTGCKAFACKGGPAEECGTCGGTTRSIATGGPCGPCRGTGSKHLPCRKFVPATSSQAA